MLSFSYAYSTLNFFNAILELFLIRFYIEHIW